MADLPLVVLLPALSAEAENHTPSTAPGFPSQPRYVHFHHPGYTRPVAMFRLAAYDLPSHDQSVNQATQPATIRGIHHGTALDACCIVACSLPGFLSSIKLDQDDYTPPITPVDAVLTESDYWYYPTGWDRRAPPYPVVPNFENWCYPSTPPPEWVQMITGRYAGPIPAASQYSITVNARDESCRISNFTESTEIAHLVPEEEYNWFMRNDMFLWNLNDQLDGKYKTHYIENLLRLRSDLHKIFDNKSFVLVPKRGIPTVHFLRQSPDYAKIFHNRTTEALVVSPSFLYARFGWAILGMVGNFVSHDSVCVKVYDDGTCEWKNTTARAMRQQVAAAVTLKNRNRKGDHAGGMEDLETPVESESAVVTTDQSSLPSNQGLRATRIADSTVNAFHNAVSANPIFSYHALGWYPGIAKYNEMRQRYLMQKEPVLHAREMERRAKEVAGAESDSD